MTEYSSLEDFIDRHRRLFILTGAGCSTPSGIPDYRDADGQWKRDQPVTYQAFMGEEKTRRRYWARSLIGWRLMRQAGPNDAHRALAALEARGRTELLLTQNVDRLHQAAGSERVIDLHGRIDRVRCMDCEARSPREALQDDLSRLNPDWFDLDAAEAPDGDADLEGADFSSFVIPPCRRCGGLLKPDVVFFGENVPRRRRADRRLVAHGLFGLPLRPTGREPRKAGRRNQSWPHPGGWAACAQSGGAVRVRALFSVGSRARVRLDPACSPKTIFIQRVCEPS
jgi:NAD-dependent SIR2 family protein deacetylase